MRILKVEEFKNCLIREDGVVIKPGGRAYSVVQHRGKESVNLVRDDGRKARVRIQTLMDQYFPEVVEGTKIPGFSNYLVRKNGEVYSLITNKVLKATIAVNGYKSVNLKADYGTKKVHTVHRLVAEAFVEGWFEGAHVNHKDLDKLNNNYENLEWCTNEQNIEHAWTEGSHNNKFRACKISTDNENWIEFESLKDAKEYIEKELAIEMTNVSKLTQCAKKNAEEGRLNRGLSTDVNPFRCRGYIVRYN